MNDENPRRDRDDGFDAESYWKNLNQDDSESTPPEEYWASMTDHGQGHPGEPGYGPVPEQYRSTGMSKAALACGVASLLSIIFGASLFFGAFGLLFAFLSRERKMSRQARTGAILSSIGAGAFIAMAAVSLYLLVSTGVWDYMITSVSQMNPGDPGALAEIQENVLEKVQQALIEKYYGKEAAAAGSAGNSSRDEGENSPEGSAREEILPEDGDREEMSPEAEPVNPQEEGGSIPQGPLEVVFEIPGYSGSSPGIPV